MKVAIYTAIFGQYDALKEQPSFPDTDYLCFTDIPNISSVSWRVIPCEATTEHGRIAAKRFKTMPHRYIEASYDVSIWIDGSVLIVNPRFLETCLDSLQRWGLALMRHPADDCIFSEARGCLGMQKYRRQRVLEQAEHYRALGYPAHNGLAAGGIIVRDMRIEKLKKIGEEWMHENLLWTYQDQISLPYVLWKNQHWFDSLPIDYHARDFFVLFNHHHEG